jgi:hypothetical protein
MNVDRMRWPGRAALCAAGALIIAAGAAVAGGRGQEGGSPPVPPPAGAVVLFDGKETSHWVRRRTEQPAPWPVSDGAMQVRSGDIATKENYDNFYLHLEWMEPEMPNARGQNKGNSGVGLQGRYEIQLLDSYGWKVPGKGDCGAVYSQAAPLVNACKPPLQWQTMEIIYRAPRFDAAGSMTEKPRVTVIQNGLVVQDNTEIQKPTGIEGTDRDTSKPGPIVLQDHGHPLKFRNVWVLPLPAQGSDQYGPK